ncbi:MAG: tetratricopeptide repeat protein, partial [Chloroflexota bacterium]|nr:tetratricopeptide repeat protein [Chloroflexota bacterium]
MATTVLATKLYRPPPRPKAVPRSRLVERLNEGLHRKLTLVSAPAGFGKTTLLSEWVAGGQRATAWLSLDDGDNDSARFLTYLVAALRTIAPDIGEGVLGALHTPLPPQTEPILTTLLNEIATVPLDFTLVLDDYHVIEAKQVDQALGFLLGHLPPQMHLVIATREDPPLSLSRLRAVDDLTELRAADLRFSPAEAAEFLSRVMGLELSASDVAALEDRTEGWIAGLQLAAISMRGQEDATHFVQSLTGSHRFVIDYLVEEVLQQQSQGVQAFLLRTAILDQLCGPLCDAVLRDPTVPGQATLEYLEHSNLFTVALDQERRWYRYHHLFADLLRQRLTATSLPEDLAELHRRASLWYEEQGLEIEAFRHAAAANDTERAERLIAGKEIPLYFRGTVTPVLNWLEGLPEAVLDATPSLWVMYASVLLLTDHLAVEAKLLAAEAALQGAPADDKSRDLIGRIASLRATLAVIEHDADTIIAQSRRALQYLDAGNLPIRIATTWTLGHAHQLRGDRAAATRAYNEVVANSQSYGESIYTIAATINLGQVQESDNQLALAARTYKRVLEMAGDPPQTIACEAFLGLARICYQWNDLDAAERHGRRSLELARQYERVIDVFIIREVFLARLALARGDATGAAAMLAESSRSAHRHNFVHRILEVAAAQVLTLLHQGQLAAAEQLAAAHDLPLSRARVSLAKGDPSAA